MEIITTNHYVSSTNVFLLQSFVLQFLSVNRLCARKINSPHRHNHKWIIEIKELRAQITQIFINHNNQLKALCPRNSPNQSSPYTSTNSNSYTKCTNKSYISESFMLKILRFNNQLKAQCPRNSPNQSSSHNSTPTIENSRKKSTKIYRNYEELAKKHKPDSHNTTSIL